MKKIGQQQLFGKTYIFAYLCSKVGKCFLEHADSMRTAYTQYCLNHDKAEQLLEKFDGLPEMQKVSF